MPILDTVEIAGEKYDVTNMVGGDLAICLTKHDLDNLSDEEVIEVTRKYQKMANEFQCLAIARESQWDRQFLSDSNLEIIIDGSLANDHEKVMARALLGSHEQHRYSSSRADRLKPKKKSGYIYLIWGDVESGLYKIGLSKKPFNRLETFKVTLPFDVELVCQFPADNMREAEANLHKQFDHLREKGEWFDLGEHEVAYIMSIKQWRDSAIEFDTVTA